MAPIKLWHRGREPPRRRAHLDELPRYSQPDPSGDPAGGVMTHLWRVVAIFALVGLVAAGCSDSNEADSAGRDSPAEGQEDPTEAGVTNGTAVDDDAEGSATACDSEPELLTTDAGVEFVRTPNSCFVDLPDWPYDPLYVEIDGLSQAYVDVGPEDGEVVLLLHGQPSWSYLYRKMIPVLADAGYRVIAMDHLGMGRSDKPTEIESYSFLGHDARLQAFIEDLELTDINLFVQDWGSMIGLRRVGLDSDRYATVTVGNGRLLVVPGDLELFPPVENPDVPVELESPFERVPAQQPPFYDGCERLLPSDEQAAFGRWITYSMTAASFRPSEVVEAVTWFDLPEDEEAAYDAPFPSRVYMAGVRSFPSLVRELPGVNDEAWAVLTSFERPFLTLWAANDPGSLGRCETQQELVDSVPGAVGQPHDRLDEASHFLQDDQGEEIARRMVDWYDSVDEE